MMETPRRFEWTALAQAVMSTVGAGLLAGGGLLMLTLAGVVALWRLSSQETFIFASLGWSGLLLGGLNIPSAVRSFRRLAGQPAPDKPPARLQRLVLVLAVLWPLFLVAGQWASGMERSAWLLLPPLQLLVIGAPLFWLYRAGSFKLSGNPGSRQWGWVSFGLVITQPVTLLIEVALVLFGLIAGLTVFALQPGGLDQLERLSNRLTFAMGSPDALLRIVEGFINHPLVLFAGVALTAVVIPLLEELLKPLGLWLLGGRCLTPAQGFQAGMLAGLIFALAESLGNLANPLGDQWSLVAAGRLGTGVLHITTSGLVGWGLASAWGERRLWRLSGAFLLAVLLHGGWNLFGVLLGLAELLDPALAGNAVLLRLGSIAPFAMGVLMITMVFILLGANQRLRDQPPPVEQPLSQTAQTSD